MAKFNEVESRVKYCLDTVTPLNVCVAAKVGDVDICTCQPQVKRCSKPSICQKSSTEFVIRQRLIIEVPLIYNVKVDVGETFLSNQCSSQVVVCD